MNTDTLLLSVIRSQREYKALTDELKTARTRASLHPFCVTGLTEGASPLFLTALAGDEAKAGRRVLILYASEKDAADAALRLDAAGIKACHYPARDYNFNITTASRDYEHRRLLVLSRLLFSDEPLVITATAEAVLQVTMAPEELIQLSMSVDPERPLDAEQFAKTLIFGGYSRVELVEGPGQFAVRGGIIDVFPPSEYPIRIELFGDEIDRIGKFDPATQRFTEQTEGKIIISPSHEICLDEERREEIAKLCEKQIKKLSQKSDPISVRSVEILKNEMAEAKNSADLGFADKYIPVLCPGGDCFFDYYDGLIVFNDTGAVRERAKAAYQLTMQTVTDMIQTGELPMKGDGTFIREWERVEAATGVMPSVLLDPFSGSRHPGMVPIAEFSFKTRHIPPFAGNMGLLFEDVAQYSDGGYKIAVLCANETEANSVVKVLTDSGYSAGICRDDISFFGEKKKKYPVAVLYGECDGGFEVVDARFVFLNFSGVSEGTARFINRKRKENGKNKKNKKEIMSYSDLTPGDFVVHEAYGIGLYEGIETMTIAGMTRDYVKIKYAGTDSLFLPVDQLDMLSKYIGATADGAVKLSKMGGADWTRAKTKASASAKLMAKELIELYSRRKHAKGFAFPEDDDMMRQFADAFEYDETDSQLAAIDDITKDMEEEHPMERMVCGDVGYGKTEVALRAAFKAVMGGKQVAILVPTTILAYQHYQTATSRFRGFPVSIDMLSRFRTKKEQEASLRKLRRGETDIIIGTHRIISADMEFHDLGLVIIDEEQRFGVAQKDKLKKLAIGADLLTLTATPIPRTLNMAMGGIMDMSLLDDVPGLRSPVQTYVLEHDDGIIEEAIRREIRRGGQVFYLNNNVEYLYTLRAKLHAAIPEARVAVAHGKMDHDELEEIWEALVRGEVDVLVCTTIIETGVDVPNANTLIIENADRFGLSQLHQIRGRVGRSSRRAYAYFTYPKMKQLTDIAEKRLRAMKEYAAFGAGFKIALRDLEIRGSGNLLGAEQHGHMEAVGYDMYIKLLEEAVLEEKGEAKKKVAECGVNIQTSAYLSRKYIADTAQRMEMYRKIAKIQNEDDFSDIIDELCDRYGEPSREATELCRIALIKGLATKSEIVKIDENQKDIVLSAPSPDLSAIREIESGDPGCVRVTFGNRMAMIVLKKKKGVRSIDTVLGFIEKYDKLRNSGGEGEKND